MTNACALDGIFCESGHVETLCVQLGDGLLMPPLWSLSVAFVRDQRTIVSVSRSACWLPIINLYTFIYNTDNIITGCCVYICTVHYCIMYSCSCECFGAFVLSTNDHYVQR